MFAWVLLSRRTLAFPLSDHLRFVALGILMFSSNFMLFDHGALYLVKRPALGLVFSLASVVNMLLAAIVTREPPSPRVLAGGLAGFAGIALMFYPEMVARGLSGSTLTGLLFCAGGTLCFCTGNLLSAVNQRRGRPIVSVNAWGMLYGTLLVGPAGTAAWQAVHRRADALRFRLAGLSRGGVHRLAAFAAYLTLLGRIGAARAGRSRLVTFPVFRAADFDGTRRLRLDRHTPLPGWRWSPSATCW